MSKFIRECKLAKKSKSQSQNTSHEDMSSSSFESIKKKKSNSNQKISRWTLEQNLLYVRFLKQNLDKILRSNSKCEKKYFKFERMSTYIESKTPNQCRSHHQKMMTKFSTIQNIIQKLIPSLQQTSTSEMKNKQKICQKNYVMEESKTVEMLQIESSSENNQKMTIEPSSAVQDQDIFNVLFDIKIDHFEWDSKTNLI